MDDIMQELVKRLVGILKLSVPQNQVQAADELFTRYTSELNVKLDTAKNAEDIRGMFKPYINNTLSVVETMIDNSSKTYKSCRRLMLNEIYGCQDLIIKSKEKQPAKK